MLEGAFEKLMIFFIWCGLFLSLIITIQHLSGNTHRSYDPWLLPVFVAITLQMIGHKK